MSKSTRPLRETAQDRLDRQADYFRRIADMNMRAAEVADQALHQARSAGEDTHKHTLDLARATRGVITAVHAENDLFAKKAPARAPATDPRRAPIRDASTRSPTASPTPAPATRPAARSTPPSKKPSSPTPTPPCPSTSSSSNSPTASTSNSTSPNSPTNSSACPPRLRPRRLATTIHREPPLGDVAIQGGTHRGRRPYGQNATLLAIPERNGQRRHCEERSDAAVQSGRSGPCRPGSPRRREASRDDESWTTRLGMTASQRAQRCTQGNSSAFHPATRPRCPSPSGGPSNPSLMLNTRANPCAAAACAAATLRTPLRHRK